MISDSIRAEVEKTMQDRVVSLTPLSAANNAQIYRLTMSGGRILVAKVAERGLDVEAFMLKFLKENSALPVPQVLYSNEHVIIMEYIQAQTMIDDGGQRHAAEALAALHKITAPSYGFPRDTLIGALKQPNTESPDWVYFFVERRLLYMAKAAAEENKIDAATLGMIEKLAVKIPAMLKGYSAPALIHGDVWSGNILPGRGKITAFLDPAIYYADPEVELAFIRLFNTFNSTFFGRYNELNPIRPGFFEERADIYSLYPLLVYARLFGITYAHRAQKIVKKFL